MTITSGIYIEQERPIRESGAVRCVDDTVQFISHSRQVSIPIKGLKIVLGGAGHRVLYFSHSSHPGITLHTTDKAILKVLATHGNEFAKTTLTEHRGHKNRLIFSSTILFAIIFTSIYFVLIDRDHVVGTIVEAIPPSVEESWGEMIIDSFGHGQMVMDDADATGYLTYLAKPIEHAARHDLSYPLKYYVSPNEQINAFAAPGGIVVVNYGLILEASSHKQLLGVLAHEVAHVTQRHSLKRLVHQLSSYLLLSMLVGDIDGMAAIMVDQADQLLKLEYSREHETESDIRGVDYMLSAGVDPSGLLDFFDLLAEEEKAMAGDSLSYVPELFRTHPLSENRIEALKRYIDGKEITNTEATYYNHLRFEEVFAKLKAYLVYRLEEEKKEKKTEDNDDLPAS